MFDRPKAKLHLWWLKAKLVHPASRIPWSAIRRIGQSRLVALTIIVPFLGSLLLFNQHVVDLLTLSPDIFRKWFGVGDVASREIARDVTLNRLYFVYFGLFSLGIGSGLFALFCPLEIKNYGSAREYLQVEGSLITEARMGLITPHVADSYLKWAGADMMEKQSPTRILAEPDEFNQLFYAVAQALYVAESKKAHEEEVAWRKEHGEPPAQESPPINLGEDGAQVVELDLGEHVDHGGYPDPWKIADSLALRRRVEQGFVYRINQLAMTDDHRIDVLTLQYMALDHSKPWLRLLVSALYAAGFGFMLWPTASTFVKIVSGLMR